MSRVLITGATRGIGRALTERLVGAGHEVLGAYRSSTQLATQLETKLGASCRMIQCDLSDGEQHGALVDALGGPLDGVVLNAGIAVRAGFETLEVDGRDPLVGQLHDDLVAPLRLARALLRADRIADAGALVFSSSNLARHGLAGKVAYSAAKAGLEGAVRGLARELGPRGIRVNAVAPGLLKTDMSAEVDAAGWERYAAEVPLGRAGTPEDIAPVIEFLLGPAAGYLTGQVLDVDGGWGA